ncbi:MAG TPA: alpha/beta fold hydrolase [Candidatus Dormibacteraeota bacterium]|nr:alpha/beta fold hydrolase [Candidatus Dormibacteraeota bacterium]
MTDTVRTAPTLQRGYLIAGGLRLHHVWGGEGEAVLFLHGLGSAGDIGWRYALPAIARKHLVLAPDMPGFGRSEKPRSGYGLGLFTASVISYLDALGIAKAAVVGVSMGGRVALELARRYPQRLSRLILVDALGLGFPRVLGHAVFMLPGVGETALTVSNAVLRYVPAEGLRRATARLRLFRYPERSLDDAYLEAIRDVTLERRSNSAYLATLRSLARRGAEDLSGELAHLPMPVRLIWGADDVLFPVEQAWRAHALTPEARLAVIEDAGHSPEIEQPDAFNSSLERFLHD